MEEVWKNGGSYSPARTQWYKEREEDGKKLPNLACFYCYALGNNGGNALPKRITDDTRASFERHRNGLRNLGVVRIGKLTEPGHPYYWETLSGALDLCKEYGAQIVMTTKMFPYGLEGTVEADAIASSPERGITIDTLTRIAESNGLPKGEEMSKQLKDVGASILYGLGWDHQEVGPSSQGCTNEWRIGQAVKYHSQGVNTSLTVVCDVTSSIDENVARGSPIRNAFSASDETGIPVRFIPFRPNSKAVAKAVVGDFWESITWQPTTPLPGMERAETYLVKANNKERIPRDMHPDFASLLEQGAGFCGQVGSKEYCDKCNLGRTKNAQSKQNIRFEVTTLSPLPYRGPERTSRKKKKKPEVNPGQEELFKSL